VSVLEFQHERTGGEAGVQVPLLPDPGRALAQSAYDGSAALHKLGFRQLVLKCVDEPIAPDTVIGIHRVASPAARDAVVKACIDARHQLNARVVAAEFLRLQPCPHSIVLITSESVLAKTTLKPVVATVVTGMRCRSRTHNTDTCTAFARPSSPHVAVVISPRTFAARRAGIERRVCQSSAAVIAGRFAGRPLRSKLGLGGRGPSAVLGRARPAQQRCPVRAALCATVFAESFSDASCLGRFVCHAPIIQPAEALRSSLRRWCKTVPRVAQGGDRQ